MFQFRLENVIQLRERQRDTAAQAYQQASAAIDELNRRIEELRELHDAQASVQSACGASHVDPQRMLESQRYQMHLKQQISGIKSKLELVEVEREKRRLHLVHKEQEVRSIEKLREKQLAAWKTEQLRKQQFMLDEWAGFKHWSKQRQASESE